MTAGSSEGTDTNQPVPHGVTAKTMPICPLSGHWVFVLGGYWSSSWWSRQGKTLETTLLGRLRPLMAKTKPWRRNNKHVTPEPHQNKWIYKKKQQVWRNFEKNRKKESWKKKTKTNTTAQTTLQLPPFLSPAENCNFFIFPVMPSADLPALITSPQFKCHNRVKKKITEVILA